MVEPTAAATVVGGGPAGLMAAEVLGRAGLSVCVYDHMASVGRKFQLAGRGGLNLTHSEDRQLFLERYGARRGDLEAALTRFGPADLRDWAAGLGERTFVGSSGRVFPDSFRATPLLRAWLARLGDLGVSFEVRHRWLGWPITAEGTPDGRGARFLRRDGTTVEVSGRVVVMALGGASWPRVGSDGGWVEEFARSGVAVSPLRPANAGLQVEWSDVFKERFAGVPLKNVAVQAGGAAVRGDIMVTATGLEGGPIYAHSAAVRAELDRGVGARVVVDLHPDLTVARLGERFERRRRPKDSASTWLGRCGLDPVAISLLREVTDNQIPTDPHAAASLAKAVPVDVVAMMPIDRAISTAGGVAFDELDASFMLRRLPGTFLAGEMLDWEAPTGGYLLQASFSTAVAAASGALDWLGINRE